MYKEQILDRLIDEIIAGRPAHGDDPLAGVAGQLSRLNELQPRPAAKAASRDLMLARAAGAAKPAPARSWLRRRLTTIVASGMALTMATSSTVYAASNSLPGDVLYPVKEATENVGLAFTPNGQARAEAQVRLARIRLAEIKMLMRRKDKRRIGLAVRALNRRLALARSEGGLTPRAARRIKAAADSLDRSTTRWLAPGLRLKSKQVPAPGLIRRQIKAPSLNTSGSAAPNSVAPSSRQQTRPRSLRKPDNPALSAPNRPAPPAPQIVKPSRPVVKSIRLRLRARQSK